MRKPDVQIVVTIPRECSKDTVEAMRAVCDGVLNALTASEYSTRPEYGYNSYTEHHFTRSVRFEVEAPAAPPETASVETTP